MIRGHLSLILLACAFTSAVWAADAAAPADTDRVSVPIHYSDQAVVISTKDGVAIVRFTDAIPQGRKYSYRFLPKGDAAKEEQGVGKVFEKYDRKPAQPPKDSVEVTDDGGQLKLIAGKVSLEWSWNSDGSGWLYFVPEEERVHLVSADDFQKLKLSRFAK